MHEYTIINKKKTLFSNVFEVSVLIDGKDIIPMILKTIKIDEDETILPFISELMINRSFDSEYLTKACKITVYDKYAKVRLSRRHLKIIWKFMWVKDGDSVLF